MGDRSSTRLFTKILFDKATALFCNSDARQEAIDALGDIGETLVNTGKPANTVVDGLVKALNDKSKDIRKNAADKLGDVGVASQTAISTLVEALSNFRE